MVTRTGATGRGTAVAATTLAARNLTKLRSAWSRELAAVLGDGFDSVRQGVTLLTELERRLTTLANLPTGLTPATPPVEAPARPT
jgi:hypothetical protein